MSAGCSDVETGTMLVLCCDGLTNMKDVCVSLNWSKKKQLRSVAVIAIWIVEATSLRHTYQLRSEKVEDRNRFVI